ncbi:MAG: polysaccharide deacetylase family protein [Methanobrevibacter sp.]|uniref:polysaccharide deacetylase family protein n=1 Tax=Methanobrevibacter sp. TaxID=66852 RepID=UPI002E772150|nr:polysaccharide deacetylase family protein [Methanobrevibacter sp.]MEE0935860.1 polysaccharide deacetylase family protein [Methanobrevibacter sp.]
MILLSFDIEEFDGPREHGVDYSLEEGMKVSIEGTELILDVLKANDVRATFFCTANFAENAPDVMMRILDDGHEVACHGVDHFEPKETDFERSKEIVERICGITVTGYRQPRMFSVVESEIKRVGYRYNSSLNPAFIPGRYMNLKTPRTWFVKDGVMQIPASVTPWFRFPLFWLSLHNLPESVYHWMVRRVLKKDGYFVTYFHPWEFYDLKDHPEFKMQYIIRKNSGQDMVKRLDNLIMMLKRNNHRFITYNEFVDMVNDK